MGRMRWEINKTVTYLPFPEAGLHNLSSLPSLFSLYSFRLFPIFLSLFHTRDSQQPKGGAKHFNLTWMRIYIVDVFIQVG